MNKNNYILSNRIVSFIFLFNMILIFVGTYNGMCVLLGNSYNGFAIIIIPILASMYSTPSYIGLILSSINERKKSYIMLIFVFIFSLLSIFTTICSYSNAGNTELLFWICLACNIVLSIIILLKLILKIK